MSDRIEHIRKRIAKRKKERERYVQTMMTNWSEEEKYGNPTVVTYDVEREPPLFRKDIFLLKSFLISSFVFWRLRFYFNTTLRTLKVRVHL
ncbi:hypothetical protein LR68_03105 [Anoxybacillus sp. BCO1]|nr:hypothetical protein LR68_03105 [Anoxybacillus sp. BCO1]